MFQLQVGKSYLWGFPVFVVFFIACIAIAASFGHFHLGIVAMPAFAIVMLSSELRSGVALDSWWRATYPKGTWQYRALIGWQLFSLAVLLVIVLFVLSGANPEGPRS